MKPEDLTPEQRAAITYRLDASVPTFVARNKETGEPIIVDLRTYNPEWHERIE